MTNAYNLRKSLSHLYLVGLKSTRLPARITSYDVLTADNRDMGVSMPTFPSDDATKFPPELPGPDWDPDDDDDEDE